MKILFFTETAFNLSETFIYNQINNPNIIPIIVCHEIKNLHLFKSDEFEIIKIKSTPITFQERIKSFIYRMRNKTSFYSFPYSDILLIEELIKKEEIKLIHCNYGHNAIKFLPIAKKLKVPIICHFHGFDSSTMLLDKTYVKQIKKVFKFANGTITVSKNMTERLKNFGLNVSKNCCIPYGVDLDLITAAKKDHPKTVTKTLKVLHAGRLTEKKGVPDLVKAFSNVLTEENDTIIKLELIGDGEERGKIKDIIDNLKINHKVNLSGAKSHQEVLKAMQNADIFVLNSRTSSDGDMEGFPNTIIEAMASGCAVISTYHAGIPEAIDNNENGILIEENDNIALTKAIQSIVKNTAFRKKLQKNAKMKAFQTFSLEQMIGKYTDLYLKTLLLTK